ncbi:hypothetical protein K469DRAFT_708064 [Zopfia rhizophila CBS 207.26]|uniref:Uncharacterized protein n=1 Tax=Zopfia rhizophila CBS 207.26 TaxID=1314779 RepID=A0A6A6E244_9PEZI|nr:hypothetical protein K469DRAFT_708064 [Zopfia rhizophila CBS 207.26]
MIEESPGLVAARCKSQRVFSEHYHVPHIAVPKFFGRQKLIAELQTFLLKPQGQYDKPSVAVLQALGGQGKSQVALELCRILKKDCRGIFWLDATSKATLERGFGVLAGKLNQLAASGLEDTESKVRLVLDTIQEWEERWLIVYDNYDRPDVFTDIKQFLPQNGQGGILFTSRHEATKVLGRHVQVPSMINDGGVELLLRDISDEKIEHSWADGEGIVRRLGGLALAIEQAAAYISFNQITLPKFIDEYERKKAKVLKHMREELWDYQKLRDGSEQSEALSAFTTWEMSFEQVEQRGKARKEHITRFLSVAAFLEPSHIGSYLFETYVLEEDEPFPWLDVFMRPSDSSDEESDSDANQASSPRRCGKTNWSKDRFWLTVERLYRLSLVQSIERKSVVWFSIHPVISDWLQLRERKRSNREKTLREAIGLMSVVVGSSFAEVAEASRRQELLAHLDSCLTNSRYLKRTIRLGCADMRTETNSFGWFYQKQGKYDRSEELYEALLKEDRRSLDGSDMKLLQSMANLASTYRNQGRWDAAEELFVQVMETRKKKLGADHPSMLTSMANLASTLWNQGRWDAAEELEVQVMETSKKKLGADHPSTLTSMANLAFTWKGQGRDAEAIKLMTECVQLHRHILGASHPHYMSSSKTLARWEAEQVDADPLSLDG